MIHSAKEAKSEAQNPKFETISKLQIQTFQTSPRFYEDEVFNFFHLILAFP